MAGTTKHTKRQSNGLNGSKERGNAAVTPLLSAQLSVQKNKSVSAQKSTSSSSLLSSSSLGAAEIGRVSSSEKSKQNSGRQKRTIDDVEGAGALGVGGNKKQRRSARYVVPEKAKATATKATATKATAKAPKAKAPKAKARAPAWTKEENILLIGSVELYGMNWPFISTFFKDRVESAIKSKWTMEVQFVRNCLTPEEIADSKKVAAAATSRDVVPEHTSNSKWDNNASLSSERTVAASSLPPPPPSSLPSPRCLLSSPPSSSSEYENNDRATPKASVTEIEAKEQEKRRALVLEWAEKKVASQAAQKKEEEEERPKAKAKAKATTATKAKAPKAKAKAPAWTKEEKFLLIGSVELFGMNWPFICTLFKDRVESAIKSKWYYEVQFVRNCLTPEEIADSKKVAAAATSMTPEEIADSKKVFESEEIAARAVEGEKKRQALLRKRKARRDKQNAQMQAAKKETTNYIIDTFDPNDTASVAKLNELIDALDASSPTYISATNGKYTKNGLLMETAATLKAAMPEIKTGDSAEAAYAYTLKKECEKTGADFTEEMISYHLKKLSS